MFHELAEAFYRRSVVWTGQNYIKASADNELIQFQSQTTEGGSLT